VGPSLLLGPLTVSLSPFESFYSPPPYVGITRLFILSHSVNETFRDLCFLLNCNPHMSIVPFPNTSIVSRFPAFSPWDLSVPPQTTIMRSLIPFLTFLMTARPWSLLDAEDLFPYGSSLDFALALFPLHVKKKT